jgi:hypothetical protein
LSRFSMQKSKLWATSQDYAVGCLKVKSNPRKYRVFGKNF